MQATLVPRKEEPKADEGAAKPKPQLVKRKSFEEKAAETQARLEAKLAKFHQDQEQKRIQEEVMKMRRREKEKKKKKKEKKKEKEAKLGGKKSKRKLSE
ncbi:unnamed protein product [Durusdinium trenchii]|uniref:Uncharacterized protein n=1 Tax=Durusdinium trenchii TaxID=1381693 RepID=A0ABP0RIN6_9DINO